MVCLLREGWEQSNDRLYALDRAAADARYTRLAKELAEHPQHAVAVEHVRLFDSPKRYHARRPDRHLQWRPYRKCRACKFGSRP